MTDPIPEHQRMVGRLCIPYITDDGPVGAAFRCIQAHDCQANQHPKYMKAKGSEVRLFGVQQIFLATDTLFLAEGELDSVIASDNMGMPCVGIPGASNWKSHWNGLFEDFERVIVLADNDKAGQDLAKKANKEVGAVAIFMPEDEDINSTYLRYGSKFIKDLLAASEDSDE